MLPGAISLHPQAPGRREPNSCSCGLATRLRLWHCNSPQRVTAVTAPSNLRETFRFGDFELDVTAYELRRDSRRVRLERRPMDLLILMVQRNGQLITRGEIVERLWGKDVFIEVEPAVNTLVRKVRQALRDSPDTPTFVETVPGKGYRFIAPVVVAAPAPAANIAAETAATETRVQQPRPRPRIRQVAAAALLLLVAGAIALWGWKASRPVHVRLAVLPFDAIQLNPGLAYLPDALQQETIAALGQVDPEYIEVITQRSMLPYRQTAKPLLQIANELRVEYLVGSSIHEEDGRIRVIAKLIRARDQVEIWNAPYDYEPRSILEFQRNLSLRMAREIRRTLSSQRLDALTRRHTDNAQAYQLYHQGLDAWNKLRPPQTTESALRFYNRATELDPDFALPWAGLALAYAGAPINADAPPAAVAPRARHAAQQAIATGEWLAEAQTAMGAVSFWFDWDWGAAENWFRKATATDPSYAFAQRMMGILLSHQGRHDEARERMRLLVNIEAGYEMNWALRAQVAINAGEYPAAIEFAKDALARQPAFWVADFQLAQAYEQAGTNELALQALDRHASAPGARPNSKLLSLRAYVLAKMNRHEEARDLLHAIDAAAAGGYVPPYARALVHAGLGERDAALDWLAKAVEVRDVHLIALPVDPKWKAFRSDRRFIDILQRCAFTRSR